MYINELSIESGSFINLSGLNTKGSLKYSSCLLFKNEDTYLNELNIFIDN